MAKINVGIPQGTRDFGAEVVRKRNYIFDTIRNVFEIYGFQPLETLAMENLETLLGKYGEEGYKLIYRILDSGNPFSQTILQELGKRFKEASDQFEKFKEDHPRLAKKDNPDDIPLYQFNPEFLDLFTDSKKYL